MLALLAMLPLAGSPADVPRFDGALVHRVQAIAGAGGAGGNAPVLIGPGNTIYLSPQGGSGGGGGNAIGRPAPPSPSEGRSILTTVSRCTLRIGGETLVDRAGCAFSSSDAQIQFASKSGGTNYRMVVDKTTHEGWVNSRSVGVMFPGRACWANATASICGWK
jgi:hypothetical protein